MGQPVLAQHNRKRVRLFAGGAACAPDQQWPSAIVARSQLGKRLFHQKIEVSRFAKEIRLVGRHHIDQRNELFFQDPRARIDSSQYWS